MALLSSSMVLKKKLSAIQPRRGAIPKGETRSYGDLARNLGTPRGAQWVGQANGANPIAWLVPCHRVIGNDGGIAGYAWGTTLKRAMLEAEGVRIDSA